MARRNSRSRWGRASASKTAHPGSAAAVADFSQPGYPVASLVAGKRGAGWAVEGHVRKDSDRAAVFTFAKPLAGGPGTTRPWADWTP